MPNTNRPTVLLYVQHLLGTGHVRRALILARALRNAGCRVFVVSGGPETTETHGDPDLVQLPPVRARDQTFADLVDVHGQPITNDWKARRTHILLEHYRRLRPDIVIIETYPFGRRKLRFELSPLLATVSKSIPRPLVACSVRDIVQQRSDDRVRESVEVLRQHFDIVLVHGDPDLIGFEESFTAADEIRDLIQYTGYVVDTTPQENTDVGTNEIVVSAGGGAVSMNLFKTAMDAHALIGTPERRWRILVGQSSSDQEFEQLQTHSTDGIILDRHRADFRGLLANCALSVSQAGYNTTLDILRARTRSLLVPFEGNGETEQHLRATKLEQRGVARLLPESELSPSTLADAIDRCLTGPAPPTTDFDLDGAENTVRLVLRFFNER